MSATLIDGKAVSQQIRAEVKDLAAKLKEEHGIAPGLAFILVGNNPASEVYVRNKAKACDALGFYSITERMTEDVPQQAVIDTCLSCHGAMGQRQLTMDAAAGVKLPNGQPLDPNARNGHDARIDEDYAALTARGIRTVRGSGGWRRIAARGAAPPAPAASVSSYCPAATGPPACSYSIGWTVSA